jgi:hypothetical protein
MTWLFDLRFSSLAETLGWPSVGFQVVPRKCLITITTPIGCSLGVEAALLSKKMPEGSMIRTRADVAD